jgi:hypothetical protein
MRRLPKSGSQSFQVSLRTAEFNGVPVILLAGGFGEASNDNRFSRSHRVSLPKLNTSTMHLFITED